MRHLFDGFNVSGFQRFLKGERVSAAMAFDDHPLQAKYAGAIVLARINAFLRRLHERHGKQTDKLRQRVFLKSQFEFGGDEFGGPLHALQGHVTGEAVCDDNINVPQINLISLNVAACN